MLSMAPASWRGDPTPRDRFDIYLGNDETALEIVENGEARRMSENRAFEQLEQDNWDQIAEFSQTHSLRLFLDAGDFLEIPVSLPKASASQMRSALTLQLPTLVPIIPDQLGWNFTEIGRNEKSIELSLIIARSSRLDELEALFAVHGLMPPTFCVNVADQNVDLRKPLELSSKPMSNKNMLTAIAVIAMLAMIPISTIGGAEMLASLNEERAARLEKDLGSKLAIEREAAAQEKIRRAAAPLFNIPSASNRLEALAESLPDSDWTVSSSQKPGGNFEFVVDAASKDTVETAFQQSRYLREFRTVEEIKTENIRSRVRYRIVQ